MKLQLLNKQYTEVELVDMVLDIVESTDPEANRRAARIPTDLNGKMQGKFNVTVEWEWNE